MKKQMKFKLLAFFWDAETQTDIEYNNEIAINSEHHVDFIEKFCEPIVDQGLLKTLDKQYGHHSIHTGVKKSHFIVEEFAIYNEISKEDFETLWLKWTALLKQNGLLNS